MGFSVFRRQFSNTELAFFMAKESSFLDSFFECFCVPVRCHVLVFLTLAFEGLYEGVLDLIGLSSYDGLKLVEPPPMVEPKPPPNPPTSKASAFGKLELVLFASFILLLRFQNFSIHCILSS